MCDDNSLNENEISQISFICPNVDVDLIRDDLQITKSVELTLNRILDGTLPENRSTERDNLSDEDSSDADLPAVSFNSSRVVQHNISTNDSIDLTCTSSDLESDSHSELIPQNGKKRNTSDRTIHSHILGNNDCIVLEDDSNSRDSGLITAGDLPLTEKHLENNISHPLNSELIPETDIIKVDCGVDTQKIRRHSYSSDNELPSPRSCNDICTVSCDLKNTHCEYVGSSSLAPALVASQTSHMASLSRRPTHDLSDSEGSDSNDAVEIERKPLCDLLKSNGLTIPFRNVNRDQKIDYDESESDLNWNYGSSLQLPETVSCDAMDCDSVGASSADLCLDSPKKDKKPAVKRKKRTAEEIAEQKRQAQMKKEERERERKEKLEQKQKESNFKKVVRESKKQYKPGDCLKFITLVVDNNVVNNCGLGAALYKMAGDLGIKCVTGEQAVPNTILWKREVTECNAENTTAVNVEVTEDDILCVMAANELSELVHAFTERQNGLLESSHQTLKDHIQYLQSIYTGKILTVVGLGMDKYFRDQKTNKNRKHREAVRHLGQPEEPPKAKRRKQTDASTTVISRVNLEEAVTDAQLFTGCNIHLLSSMDEVASFVKSMTKAVAEKPAKKDRLDSIFSFLEEGTKNVKVDKDGNGLIKVWKSQLLQFKNVGADMADAIVSAYPSPQLLVQAYKKCTTEKEGERLLENIVVRRGAGVLETNRRIGKELSRRIYLLFSTRDPDFVIK